jgi:septal ring factor EnvC (AmiA/AmiB activator)
MVDDENLKEFYMFLYIYIHGEDPDFNVVFDYLKTKTKCLIVDKYTNYCEYMKQREEIQIEEDNYENEKDKLGTTIEYLEELKKKLDGLLETKAKLINQLNTKIDEKEEGN